MSTRREVERADHFASHEELKRGGLDQWLAATERLPGSPGEVYQGRLWLRNCRVCKSTVARRLDR